LFYDPDEAPFYTTMPAGEVYSKPVTGDVGRRMVCAGGDIMMSPVSAAAVPSRCYSPFDTVKSSSKPFLYLNTTGRLNGRKGIGGNPSQSYGASPAI